MFNIFKKKKVTEESSDHSYYKDIRKFIEDNAYCYSNDYGCFVYFYYTSSVCASYLAANAIFYQSRDIPYYEYTSLDDFKKHFKPCKKECFEEGHSEIVKNYKDSFKEFDPSTTVYYKVEARGKDTKHYKAKIKSKIIVEDTCYIIYDLIPLFDNSLEIIKDQRTEWSVFRNFPRENPIEFEEHYN